MAEDQDANVVVLKRPVEPSQPTQDAQNPETGHHGILSFLDWWRPKTPGPIEGAAAAKPPLPPTEPINLNSNAQEPPTQLQPTSQKKAA